jgi:hypothetical protein
MPCWENILNNTTLTVGVTDIFGEDPPHSLSGYTIWYVRDLSHGNGLDIGLGTDSFGLRSGQAVERFLREIRRQRALDCRARLNR